MSQNQNESLKGKKNLNIYTSLYEKKDKFPVRFHQIKYVDTMQGKNNFHTDYLINKYKMEEKRHSFGVSKISYYSRKETTSSKKKISQIQTNFELKDLPKKNNQRKIEQINYRPLFTLTYSKIKIMPNERYNKNNINNNLKKGSFQDLIDLVNTGSNNLDINNRKRNVNTHNHSLYISNNIKGKNNIINNNNINRLNNNKICNNNKNKSSSFSREVSGYFSKLEYQKKFGNLFNNKNELIKKLKEEKDQLHNDLISGHEIKKEKKSELAPDNRTLINIMMEFIRYENNSFFNRLEKNQNNLVKKISQIQNNLMIKLSENQTNLMKELFKIQRQENIILIRNFISLPNDKEKNKKR